MSATSFSLLMRKESKMMCKKLALELNKQNVLYALNIVRGFFNKHETKP